MTNPQGDGASHYDWHEDPHWGIKTINNLDDEAEHLLHPAKAWESDPERFLASINQLKQAFKGRLNTYQNTLPEALQKALLELRLG